MTTTEVITTTEVENVTKLGFDEDGWNLYPLARECYYIGLGMQWLNVVLIVSLNTAVIVTILRYKKKSRLYFLLMHMAIADLTTGIIDALVNALERSLGAEYITTWWFAGDVVCRIQRTLSNTSLLASNLILAATSVDRALVVAKPMLNFKRGNTLQKILIICCWSLSAAICSPLLKIYHQEIRDPHYMEGKQSVPKCTEGFKLDEWKVFYVILLVFFVLIPLSVIIMSYSILIYAIYKRARSPPNSIHGVDNMRISLVFNRGLPSSKRRSIKLTFGIVLGFIGAWSPFFIILYMNIFHNFSNPIVMLFIPTYFWNCIVNPIAFFIFHRRRGSTTMCSVYSSDTVLRRFADSANSSRSTPIRDIEKTLLKANVKENSC